jgi:hypothetical protein
MPTQEQATVQGLSLFNHNKMATCTSEFEEDFESVVFLDDELHAHSLGNYKNPARQMQ